MISMVTNSLKFSMLNFKEYKLKSRERVYKNCQNNIVFYKTGKPQAPPLIRMIVLLTAHAINSNFCG